MAGLQRAHIVVAGAGALGASTALVLALAGARVVLADPAVLGDNASGVAAGMLAPAFEAILDEGSRPHFALMRAARELWLGFADDLGDIGFRRGGAVWVDLPAAAPAIDSHERALASLGVETTLLPTVKLQTWIPGLAAGVGPGLFTAEDWRLEPGAALAALHRAVLVAGGRIAPRSVVAFRPGAAQLESGETLAADILVLATGAARSGLAPELAGLTPVKGQILHYQGAGSDDDRPAIRCLGGYAVAGRGGLRVGATMEPGLADRQVTEAATTALAGVAAALFPALNGAPFVARAGVRAATRDGLPLVGPSVIDGVWLATGARRNGWLLAPLVARMLAAYLADRDPGPYAGLLAARRFAST